jgi:hypothetical protein
MKKKKITPRIRFQSYNPYEARFPNLRVVSRETLDLIKYLRSQGYDVIVEPNDGSTLHYISRKGVLDLLSDPIMLFVLGIPVAVLVNLISSWLYEHLKRVPTSNGTKIAIEFDEQGKKVRYNHSGTPISEERFRSMLAELSERTKRYAELQKIKAPDEIRPIPIHLEHSDKIIGWAERFSRDSVGIRVEGIRITEDEVWQRVQSGDLKGLSIAGIVTHSTCSICNSKYVDCNHITGEAYSGKECVNRIDSFLIAEISIVAQPTNPLAQITITR